MIRRTILFDNQCGFALGENSRAPNPYVTWRFNEQDGHRNYFWGHYMNEPDMAERDLLNRAEDYQRRYHVQEVGRPGQGNLSVLLHPAAYRHRHLPEQLL